MNKFTYGNTPAAIYLFDYLEKLNKKIVKKRVGKMLTSHRQIFSQLAKANENGILTAHNLARLIGQMRDSFHVDVGDEHASNLVTNILVGEMKDLLRRTSTIRKIELHQNKLVKKEIESDVFNKEGYLVVEKIDEDKRFIKYNINNVKDSINEKTLNDKWNKRMIAKGWDFS